MVVLICISTIISNVKHLFMCFLAISVFFEEMSISIFCPGLHVFLILSCMSCLYILEIKPLLAASFANIFSQSVGCLFGLFMVSFSVQNGRTVLNETVTKQTTVVLLKAKTR